MLTNGNSACSILVRPSIYCKYMHVICTLIFTSTIIIYLYIYIYILLLSNPTKNTANYIAKPFIPFLDQIDL